MLVEVLSEDPHQPIEQTIIPLIQRSSRVELAVAFLTRYGADRLKESVSVTGDDVTIVVSVRAPTDLDAVHELYQKWPGRVWIDLGFSNPQEPYTGMRAQLHSKVVITKSMSGTVDAIVGSHNWTRMALTGRNGEASIKLSGTDDDEEIGQLRRHITALRDAETCEFFDPDSLEFYKAVQRSEKPAHDDFTLRDVLVVRAEALGTADKYPRTLLTFVPSDDAGLSTISQRTPVHLYLYDQGHLHGQPALSLQDPLRYEGTVQMINQTASGSVTARSVDSVIDGRVKPVLTLTTTIPAHQHEYEVVFKVERMGSERRPPLVYAQAGPKPSVKRTIVEEAATDPGRDMTGEDAPSGSYNWYGGAWSRPKDLQTTVTIRVPYPKQVYGGSHKSRIRELLGARPASKSRSGESATFEINDGATSKAVDERSTSNPFWFRVCGWLSENQK